MVRTQTTLCYNSVEYVHISNLDASVVDTKSCAGMQTFLRRVLEGKGYPCLHRGPIELLDRRLLEEESTMFQAPSGQSNPSCRNRLSAAIRNTGGRDRSPRACEGNQ